MFQLSDSEKQSSVNGVTPILPEQEELIHRLVYFQNEYEHPSEEDVKRIMVSYAQRLTHDCEQCVSLSKTPQRMKKINVMSGLEL